MAAGVLAKDIYHFMFAYKPRVPPGVLAKYLIALLNFELSTPANWFMQPTIWFGVAAFLVR
ncbi:hypothetical protein HYR99_38005 [Candidatus Poribacteria bacterium]|nr:hypothetical protein [Candidatus Poribacteria bacterium]